MSTQAKEPKEPKEPKELKEPKEPQEPPPARFWSVDGVGAMDFDPVMEELLHEDSMTRIKLPHGEGEAWVAAKYEDVRFVTTDPRFSREALVGRDVTRLAPHFIPLDDAVGFTDPPEHTRLRKLVASAFTARRVEALRPRVTSIVNELIDAMARRP